MLEEVFTETPFEELPESLVDELLSECEPMGDTLYDELLLLKNEEKKLRDELKENVKISIDRDDETFIIPTTCAVDGSYVIDRLLSFDIVALAAVAIEGLTPPTEEREWPKPRHMSFIKQIPHFEGTSVVARGLMMQYEMILLSSAPHKIKFLDNSMTTPLIYLNQAVKKLGDIPNNEIKEKFVETLKESLEAYLTILSSPQNDRHFVGVPKYSTRREIGNRINTTLKWDDKALLSKLLRNGEYTNPIKLSKQKGDDWHLKMPKNLENLQSLIDKITKAIENIHVIYYKPKPWFPALRLEVSNSIANNSSRIGEVLKGVEYQCATSAIMEPYPLYMSDRMVKHLKRALPAIRQAITQHTALRWEENAGEIYLTMHGYRTESGR